MGCSSGTAQLELEETRDKLAQAERSRNAANGAHRSSSLPLKAWLVRPSAHVLMDGLARGRNRDDVLDVPAADHDAHAVLHGTMRAVADAI
jgi:hypothetical protein